MIKNTIHAILNRQAISIAPGKRARTNAGRKWLQSQACVGHDPTEFWTKFDPTEWWRGQVAEELRQLREVDSSISSVDKKLDAYAATKQHVRRLCSTTRVGPCLSEAVAAYAGWVPRVFQSGKMDRKGGITGAGNRYLRTILVEVSWLGLRNNPRMKQVFDRVCHGGPSRRKIAIVEVPRRLLIWCWAMMRDDQDWNPRALETE